MPANQKPLIPVLVLALALATAAAALWCAAALRPGPGIPTAPPAIADSAKAPGLQATEPSGLADPGPDNPAFFAKSPAQEMAAPDPLSAKVDAMREEAAKKAAAGDIIAAIGIMDEAIRTDPDNDLLQREMSQLYAAQGWKTCLDNSYRRSREFFKESLHYWPENKTAVRGMGYAYFKEQNRDQALQWFKFYVELGGDRPDVFALAGRLLYESDHAEDALYYLETSLSLSPEQPEVVELAAKIRREIKVEEGFFEAASSHFVVRYEGREMPGVGGLVMLICEEAYLLAGSRLGYYPDDPTVVMIYTDQQFQDVTRSPAWAGAVFDGKIRIPAKGLTQRSGVLERIIFHEYTHAAVYHVSGGRAPVWLHEGLAQISEGGRLDSAAMAARIMAAGGPRPLSELEGSFMGMPISKAELAYGESWLAVTYLYEKYGPYSIRELLRLLSLGDNIGDAISGLTSRDYAIFDQEFRAWVKQVSNE